MNNYEMMYILDSEMEESAREALLERVKGVIESDGSVESVEEWGLRKLAYEIRKQREGFYYLLQFQAGPDLPRELDRNMKIWEGILRHMIVKNEES